MRTNYLKAIFCLLFLSITAFTQAQTKITKQSKALAAMLAGAYHNKTQAAADSDFFEIHLQMKPIWSERKDGSWLYVEQAVAKALDKPYRQRIYKVYQREDGTLVSEIFSLPNPLRFAGAHKNEKLLTGLTIDSLLSRGGCEVLLKPTSKGFEGATIPKNCPSDLRGAKYATSEVVVTDKQLISWDRGYDANDKQVWGATKGGYIFDKQANLK